MTLQTRYIFADHCKLILLYTVSVIVLYVTFTPVRLSFTRHVYVSKLTLIKIINLSYSNPIEILSVLFF